MTQSDDGLSFDEFDPPTRQAIARALLKMAGQIEGAATPSEAGLAAIAYAHVVEVCEGDLDPSVRATVATSRLERGIIIGFGCSVSGNMQDLPEAIACFEQVIRECGQDPDPELRGLAVEAGIRAASICMTFGQLSAGMSFYNRVVATFGNDPDPRVRESADFAARERTKYQSPKHGPGGRS